MSQVIVHIALMLTFIFAQFSHAQSAADRSPFENARISQEGSPIGSEAENLLARLLTQKEVVFLQNFIFDDQRDAYQCQGAMGVTTTKLNDWTPAIRINTDSGWGGCQLAYALLDPDNKLTGLQMFINFEYGDGNNTGECGNIGRQEIHRTNQVATYTQNIRIDADGRPSWCKLTFEVKGRNDIELNIQFYADDPGGPGPSEEQCRNRKKPGEYHTAKPGQPAWVGFDTDARWGGCRMLLQLKKTSPN